MMIQWSMSSHFHYHSHPGLVSGNWPKPLLCKSPRTPPWRTAIRSYSEWSAHVVTTLTQLCRGWQPHHKKLVHFEPRRTKNYAKMTWLRNCKLQTATIYASTFIKKTPITIITTWRSNPMWTAPQQLPLFFHRELQYLDLLFCRSKLLAKAFDFWCLTSSSR